MKPVTAFGLISAVILWSAGLSAASSEIQSLASIRLQAEAYLSAYPYASPYPARFRLGTLDSRLRLRACAEPLQVEFARPGQDRGNTALRIRCVQTGGWKIHLPLRVDLFDDVAVASKPLLKGQLIDASSFRFEKRNVVRLKNGYFAKRSALQRLEAKRNLVRGAVLTPKNLAPRLLVRAGQQVTLVLSFRGLQVKSTGKALQSASLGELVRVRNSQSLKIVEGVVTGEGLVQVNI